MVYFIRGTVIETMTKKIERKPIAAPQRMKKVNTSCRVLTDNNFNHEVLEYSRPVVVEFAADWCGPCHIINPIVDRLAVLFYGQIKFCKIDFDVNPVAKTTYGIRELPTLLFFNQGEVVDHIIGAASQKEISKRLEDLLQKQGN